MTGFPGWDLPFEEQPDAEMTLDGMPIAGGIVVMGAVAPTPVGRLAVLIFRFTIPGQPRTHDVALLLDPARMRQVAGLVDAAASAAIRRAAGGPS